MESLYWSVDSRGDKLVSELLPKTKAIDFSRGRGDSSTHKARFHLLLLALWSVGALGPF